jgi:hypothetical protein
VSTSRNSTIDQPQVTWVWAAKSIVTTPDEGEAAIALNNVTLHVKLGEKYVCVSICTHVSPFPLNVGALGVTARFVEMAAKTNL